MDILEMPREDYAQRQQVKDFYLRNIKNGICIQADDISYSYHNGKQVFSHTSLCAEPRKIIALVGPSGQGKTTMLRILLALLTPQEGELRLYASKNPNDTLTFSPAIRQLYSYVPQGNTMFSGTVAENMRNVKPEASEEEIIQCLKKACAWEFVSAMPDGINSIIGERGGGLSEGQAQRLSIARALLRNSPILLLDEATSALDITTEREVLKNIMKDDSPRTCIVTTHRPTVLNLCSIVYSVRDNNCKQMTEDEIIKMIKDF